MIFSSHALKETDAQERGQCKKTSMIVQKNKHGCVKFPSNTADTALQNKKRGIGSTDEILKMATGNVMSSQQVLLEQQTLNLECQCHSPSRQKQVRSEWAEHMRSEGKLLTAEPVSVEKPGIRPRPHSSMQHLPTKPVRRVKVEWESRTIPSSADGSGSDSSTISMPSASSAVPARKVESAQPSSWAQKVTYSVSSQV